MRPPDRNLAAIPVQDWELDALAAMLDRVPPATPAEEWMRNRVLDQRARDLRGGDPRL